MKNQKKTKIKGIRYAYIRVSTSEQNEDRQIQEISAFCDVVVIEKQSGTKINEKLEELLVSLVPGDELCVLSLDRLSRSTAANIKIIDTLTNNGIAFRSIRESLYLDPNNMNPRDKFTWIMYSAFGEYERTMLRERQSEGIAARQKRKKALNQGYNKHSQRRLELLRNKRFHQEMHIKTRAYMMETYNLSQASYYNYRRDVLKK